MPPGTAKAVERVADRHVKRLTAAFENGLAAGSGNISEAQLAALFERGNRTGAQQAAARGADAGTLRVLEVKRPLEDRLLDVAEDSANATRCAVRPTGTGIPAAPTGGTPTASGTTLEAVRAMVGTDTVAVTADMSRAIRSTPMQQLRGDLPSVAEMQAALSEAARVARFDATDARMRSMDIAALRPTKPLRGDSELVVRYRQGLPVPPVVVNVEGVILDGHERVASAWAAGLNEIPAVVVRSEDTAGYLEWLRWNN